MSHIWNICDLCENFNIADTMWLLWIIIFSFSSSESTHQKHSWISERFQIWFLWTMKFDLGILVCIVFVFSTGFTMLYHSKKYTFHKQSRKIWNKCNIQKTPPNCSWRHLDFSQIKCEFCDKFKKMFDHAEKLRLNLYNSYIVHYHYVYWWFFVISVTGRKHEAQIL